MKLQRNYTAMLVIPVLLLILAGCPKVEQDARDTAAALGGAVVAAQNQHQAECTADPKQSVCVLINNSIDAQHALITSIEAYCGWTAGALPADPNATCVPVSTAKAGLQSAINNANAFIVSLKGAITK